MADFVADVSVWHNSAVEVHSETRLSKPKRCHFTGLPLWKASGVVWRTPSARC